jgi:hypothetical protein
MKKALAVALLLAGASAAYGDFYTWKDARGTTFYTNSMDEIPRRYLRRAKVLDVATGKKGPLGTARPAAPAGPVSSAGPAAAAPAPLAAPAQQAPETAVGNPGGVLPEAAPAPPAAPPPAATVPQPQPSPQLRGVSRGALRRMGHSRGNNPDE